MNYLLFFFGQALYNLGTCLSVRAAAKSRTGATMLTNATNCFLQFFLIQHIAAAQHYGEVAAYILGGSTGAFFGIYLTKHWD